MGILSAFGISSSVCISVHHIAARHNSLVVNKVLVSSGSDNGTVTFSEQFENMGTLGAGVFSDVYKVRSKVRIPFHVLVLYGITWMALWKLILGCNATLFRLITSFTLSRNPSGSSEVSVIASVLSKKWW